MVGKSYSAKCEIAPVCLANGIKRRKLECCLDGAKYDVAIPAVPLRSLPANDMIDKPEMRVSSHGKDNDKGSNVVNMTDDTVHQRDELGKLSKLITEATEFLKLLDARYPMSKDHQRPSLESDAFDPHTSVEEQRPTRETGKVEMRESDEVSATPVMHQCSERSFSDKRLKADFEIPVIDLDEETSGTEATCDESDDEVCVLSPAEWNVFQQCSNRKDECAKPSWKLERNLKRQSSLGLDKEFSTVSGPKKSNKCPSISNMEQDNAFKMLSTDDEAIATKSRNCSDGSKHNKNCKESIDLEILQYDHAQRCKVMQDRKLFEESREGKNTECVKAKEMNASIDKAFGHLPGIEIGDEFTFRAELSRVGLNCQLTHCVDYVTIDGKQYATSVVNRGPYDNEAKEGNILIYSCEDQEFEVGNLALMNSMKMRYPVRVIHKTSCTIGMNDTQDYVYVYDGLYTVNRFWKDEDNNKCKLVFKFELHRLPREPSDDGTDVELVNGSGSQPGSRGTDVGVLDDLSQGKEKFKVVVVNELDDDLPPPFTYITSIVYPPHWRQHSDPIGCNCINGCSDSVQCPCIIKNGGEIPFTEKGLLMRARPNDAVHECGPSCKCPPSCMNRVSQHGPRFQLEIFKTKSMGWGVRSRDFIRPGSFICEYIGEFLGENEAEERIGYDEYLFDIVHGKAKKDDLALDAAKFGNVGRFINHSCDPNVFAQKVLYDNKVPHIMFFAGKRIPPRTELRYDYNYTKIRICDANGNTRRKDCYCGSRKCSGRLY